MLAEKVLKKKVWELDNPIPIIDLSEFPEIKESFQEWAFTIYAWDVDFKGIYNRLHYTQTKTIRKTWEIVTVTLNDLRVDNTKAWDGIYVKDIFPLQWTSSQILNFYMNKNNTVWDWLPHSNEKVKKREKLVISPEVPSTEQ